MLFRLYAKHINKYTIKDPIFFADDRAPFNPSKTQKKVIKKINELYASPFDTNTNQQEQPYPIYFDELFLSKFLEDFLDDYITEENFAEVFNQMPTEATSNLLESKARCFRDGLMMLEIDRICFKVLNTLAARLLTDDKNRVIDEIYYKNSQHHETAIVAHYLITFVKEMLRF